MIEDWWRLTDDQDLAEDSVEGLAVVGDKSVVRRQEVRVPVGPLLYS